MAKNDQNPLGDKFLALPEKHHHVSKLLVWCIILAVILFVLWLVAYLYKKPVPASAPVVNAPKEVSLSEQEVLERHAYLDAVSAENQQARTLSAKEKNDREAYLKLIFKNNK